MVYYVIVTLYVIVCALLILTIWRLLLRWWAAPQQPRWLYGWGGPAEGWP